jgi:transcriptional/translational regulatory protein YebC/TACO1
MNELARRAVMVVRRGLRAVYFPMLVNPSDAQVLQLEGYGPGGAAVLLECVTVDAGGLRARVRGTFRHHGGYLGADGSVSYLFDRVGRLHFGPGLDGGRLAQAALEAGAEEVVGEERRGWDVLTDPRELESVRAALERAGLRAPEADVVERAPLTVSLSGGAARQMRELLAALAEIEGVRNVYSNVEISGAFLADV